MVAGSRSSLALFSPSFFIHPTTQLFFSRLHPGGGPKQLPLEHGMLIHQTDDGLVHPTISFPKDLATLSKSIYHSLYYLSKHCLHKTPKIPHISAPYIPSSHSYIFYPFMDSHILSLFFSRTRELRDTNLPELINILHHNPAMLLEARNRNPPAPLVWSSSLFSTSYRVTQV